MKSGTFCTTKPNAGVAQVPGLRLQQVAEVREMDTRTGCKTWVVVHGLFPFYARKAGILTLPILVAAWCALAADTAQRVQVGPGVRYRVWAGLASTACTRGKVWC